MEINYQFGYPENRRLVEIDDALRHVKESVYEEYRGKYRPLDVIEVPIELLVYRIENIRTKSLQKEWLTQHPDLSKNFFLGDSYSIEVQETQHQILKKLVNKKNLLNEFKSGKLQQKEPLICSDTGVVVNGNRRLCAWRELYYSDKLKYSHFQTIRVAVLPDHDEQGIYDLEVALQIRSDMREEYVWHTIAADYKEKLEYVDDLKKFAAKQGKKPEEIKTIVECYDYASEYLESIGQADEWSLVDSSEYAFKQIVNSRKSLNKPGDKELFQEIAKAMLQIPASGDRLYNQIPKVVKNLNSIAPKLTEVFEISIEENTDDDLMLLLGGDSNEISNINSKIAAGIRIANNPELVVSTVKTILETADELENEKKKNSFVFDQVRKAATNLTNAVSNLDDAMSKEGVKRQLDNIEGALAILRDWIK